MLKESLLRDLRRALVLLGLIRNMSEEKRIHLYETAYQAIGTDASPNDSAPDELGCAESLSKVIQKAFPELNFPTVLSTRVLYWNLIQSPSFMLETTPQYGDIIISPTGTGNGRVIGHCGIVGKTWIMSNDSRTGTWEANFTPDGWKRYYEIKGGIPTHYFRPL